MVQRWMCRLRVSVRGDGGDKVHRGRGEVPTQGVLVEGQRRTLWWGGYARCVWACWWVGVPLCWRPARHTCV